MRIFDRQEWLRVNRARARIKVFVDKYGIDELRSQVEEELKGEWVAERDFSIEDRLFLDDERESRAGAAAVLRQPQRRRLRVRALPRGERRRAEAGGLRDRRGEGHARRPHARAVPRRWRQIMRSYAGGYARTTVQQNLVLRWVREECVYDLWRALSELGLGDAGSREINDVVSCPGTDSCKLGITSSMGLNEAVQERIEALGITDALTRKMNIKISGCPNGCGQHHVGEHRLHGRVDQSRRAHDPGLHPPRRRRVRRRRGQVRHAAEAAPAVQARARGDRALDPPLRGQPPGRRGVEGVRRARRHEASSRRWSRICRCPWTSGWRR